jgi:2-dehydro-3-deoxyglucarate aldolase/4-hydroxy-2-oxoheptanedioate aldolase
MRDNPVKATLASGGRAFGALVFEFFSPGIPQLCRNAGADFVLYDMEHTGLGFETLKTQFALCRGLPLVPMVRVPRGEYHFIARAPRRGRARRHGADGEHGCRSRCHRRLYALPAARPPGRRVRLCARRLRRRRRRGQGRRAQRAHDGDTADRNPRRARQRRRRSPPCRASTRCGSGISISRTSWGIPGQFKHPDYLAAIDRIVEACEAHGKTAAFLATDDDWARDYAAKGFRMMGYGIDQAMLQRALGLGLDVLRTSVGSPKNER